MEKTLSVILCALVITLAGCQQKSAPASEPIPTIESPMQQTEPTSAPSTASPVTTSSATKDTASRKTTTTTAKKTQTSTPRLDALEKRVKRMEDAARQYGFQF